MNDGKSRNCKGAIDMPVMAQAADFLVRMGIDYEMTIISAHREPDIFFNYANR